MIDFSSSPISHFSLLKKATASGNVFPLYENVISSAYLVYVKLYFLANFNRCVSNILAIKLDIIGEVGAPCGN